MMGLSIAKPVSCARRTNFLASAAYIGAVQENA